MDPITQKTQNTGFNNQQFLLAALGYVWFICLAILFLKRDDPFIHAHAKNGTALFVLSVLWFFPVFGVIILAFELYGLYQAFIGNSYKLPIIGDWLEKYKV
ncbi:MAG: hypothetical protein AAB445_01380 [Patescibacteria group bacterium]